MPKLRLLTLGSVVSHKNEPLGNYCKGKAYCCKNDATVSFENAFGLEAASDVDEQIDIDLDIDVLGLIDINLEVQLQEQCQGRQIWGE
jgi:hypothetical protein